MRNHCKPGQSTLISAKFDQGNEAKTLKSFKKSLRMHIKTVQHVAHPIRNRQNGKMTATRFRRLIQLALLLLAGVTAFAATQPVVTVKTGKLQGEQQGTINIFRGIPYAAPPTGANRWRAPQPAAAWQGIRHAGQFSASCMQQLTPQGLGPWAHEYVISGTVNEDCLYLNIWTPAHAKQAPVLFWIPGGAFTSGSGSVPIYDGAALARQGLVVVTINYRVGIFGFFAHPDLTREANDAPPANFGLQDMIAALHWVHNNIAAFGGNPAAVTIDGQSAGSISVHDLVVSPLARDLFRGAIAESGLPNLEPTVTLAQSEQAGAAFAQSIGAAAITQLRAIPAEKLLKESTGVLRFGPIIDGVLLPAAPETLIREGKSVPVPMLVGLNADEASAMSPFWGVSSKDGFEKLLTTTYQDKAPAFAKFYPATTNAERAQASKALLRDRGLGSLYLWAKAHEQGDSQPVYAYLFQHVEPGAESARWGAFHSSEIPYVFQTFSASPERDFTNEDRRLSETISRYWVNFVRTGNPNAAGLPEWPTLQITNPKIMAFGNPPKPAPLLSPELLKAMENYTQDGGQLSMF